MNEDPAAWSQPSLLELEAGAPPSGAPPEPASAPGPAPRDSRSAAGAECTAAGSLPERLLIIDTETTHLDPDEGRCIELGAILFHLPARAVLAQLSTLLPCPENPAEPVNGIPAAVSRLPMPWREGLQAFAALLDSAQLVVAHNAAFDRRWFGRPPLPAVPHRWLCTMEDISWPGTLGLKPRPSVRDLALAHGIPVWAAHRALTDCTYLAQVFERCDNLDQLVREGLEPRHLYRACISYEDRQLARQAGFRWNDAVPGAWSRRLSERQRQGLSFPVVAVDENASFVSAKRREMGG
nr:3'-5' exonuclease [Synechococcus sp. RSCCF101]